MHENKKNPLLLARIGSASLYFHRSNFYCNGQKRGFLFILSKQLLLLACLESAYSFIWLEIGLGFVQVFGRGVRLGFRLELRQGFGLRFGLGFMLEFREGFGLGFELGFRLGFGLGFGLGFT